MVPLVVAVAIGLVVGACVGIGALIVAAVGRRTDGVPDTIVVTVTPAIGVSVATPVVLSLGVDVVEGGAVVAEDEAIGMLSATDGAAFWPIAGKGPRRLSAMVNKATTGQGWTLTVIGHPF